MCRDGLSELLSPLQITIGLALGDRPFASQAFGGLGQGCPRAEKSKRLVESLGLSSIAGASHMTYKYVYLCHKSRGFSCSFTLLPVANCALKLEVIFCVQAVVSPLLANVYLHYVFDLWVQAWRKKHARGDVIVVRYADDTVLGFQSQTEADRFLEDFRERLGKFGLELHPDKTRRIEFGRYAELNRKRRGEGKPETFDFLGFTHISGKTRKGAFTVRRKTIGKRLRAKLQEIKQQLRRRMHDPVAQTGEWLRSVVQGYFNYHAVPRNLDSLEAFRERVTRLWRRTLRRRGQKRPPNWTRLHQLAVRWIPYPRVLHPYPEQRFAASHPR